MTFTLDRLIDRMDALEARLGRQEKRLANLEAWVSRHGPPQSSAPPQVWVMYHSRLPYDLGVFATPEDGMEAHRAWLQSFGTVVTGSTRYGRESESDPVKVSVSTYRERPYEVATHMLTLYPRFIGTLVNEVET